MREAFAQNFAEAGEAGIAVAVALDGELVVDLLAGRADRAGTRPWERDTIVCVYSTTKGIVALAAHMLAERGLLDLDAPVATVWPEFAQAGKERLPLRLLLTHEAGLPVIDEELPVGADLDWELMPEALARQAPVWPPGEWQGYHTATSGWLVGESVRRAGGRTVGEFVREEIAEALGVEFLIGFGPEEDGRVADLLRAKAPAGAVSSALAAAMTDPSSLTVRSFNLAPRGPDKGPNSRAFRASEQPSANGHTNARALATIRAGGGRSVAGTPPAGRGSRAPRGDAADAGRGRDPAHAGAAIARLHDARAGLGRRARPERLRTRGDRWLAGLRRPRRGDRVRLRDEPAVGEHDGRRRPAR